MKAVHCAAHDGPESLRYMDFPDPIPSPNQVLIRVMAAGVNYADLMMRRGLYPGTPNPPHPVGFEVSGVVEVAGENVSAFQPGDRVMALLNVKESGGYAERAVADADSVFPLPSRFSFEEGAAFPVVFLTAYGCLKLCGNLESGNSVLLLAAGGGVGTAAVQLAKRWGASVIAAASSQEKLDRVRALGAEFALNYVSESLTERVAEFTGGRGVDLILDSVGGDVFDECLRLLAPLGRLVTYGISSLAPNAPQTSSLLFHSWGVLGFHMSALSSKPGLLRRCVEELNRMAEDGAVRPIVGHRFPLERADEAHRLMESRRSYGKIVLLPESG
jgi:NADPH2:quinone reductase